MNKEKYVIGVDFGTDSARAIVVNAADGSILSESTQHYTRWMQNLYCDPAQNIFRQHPQDYVDVIKRIIPDAMQKLPHGSANKVAGISMDTTGSTPVLLDKAGTPLALLDDFKDNPNAMFVLWKDHAAIEQANRINTLSKTWHTDYTKFSGGVYSSEWVWAKVLHILETDTKVADAAYSWVEHCDWMPALLCGKQHPESMMRSRCAAGHKAMWHEQWNGLPDEEFLGNLNSGLGEMRKHLYTTTFTADKVVGTLSQEWAKVLGLHKEVLVGAGALDCHFGAVGAGIEPNQLVRVMGTSTCDIMIAPYEELSDHIVKGICGQVDGSVIPGFIGLEAGQSAFGDLYAWFRDMLSWPLQFLDNEKLANELKEKILKELNAAAEKIPIEESSVIALDWINGRRTPDADQELKSHLSGISMGTTAPHIYRALVESTAFGSRAIMERFLEYGLKINEVTGIGGIANKSAFVMQTLSDVMNVPIRISPVEQSCAFGAAMFASVVSGIYPDIQKAQQTMGKGFSKTYFPDGKNAMKYNKLYKKYLDLGKIKI